MPLNPRKIVEEARKVGLIGFAGPVTLPPPLVPKVDKRKGKQARPVPTMTYPPQYIRKGPRRSRAWLVALEYIPWPNKRPSGLLKALAHANNLTPNRLNSLASAIRNAR